MIDETITLYAESLAESEIIKNCGNVSVERRPTTLYDWVVRDNSQGLFWGVCVVSNTFTRTKAYVDYLKELSETDFTSHRIPIIIMSVNTTTRKVLFGFQVVWHHARATVYHKVKFRELTYRSWGIALDNILSMDDVIRVLSTPNLRVIKHLLLSKQLDGVVYYANLIYLRNLSSNYKMVEKEVVDQKEQFNRFVFGIPENEYPSDELDSWIEEMVSKDCKIEKRKNDLLLFTTELRDLQVYNTSYLKVDNQLLFELQVDDVVLIPESGIASISKLIELFVSDTKAGDVFSFEIAPKFFSWNEWVTMYSDIKNKLESFHPLSEVFE